MYLVLYVHMTCSEMYMYMFYQRAQYSVVWVGGHSDSCSMVDVLDPPQVQSGFQKFGPPQFHPPSNLSRSHMTSILQGLQFGMRCLAQLTATQYAASVSLHHGRKQPYNHGRIILFCTLERFVEHNRGGEGGGGVYFLGCC